MQKLIDQTFFKKEHVDTVISSKLIKTIRERLSEGKRVRRTLPLGGRLHIDRTLPFLVVYRRPGRSSDNGTERFVKGEASYLIASGAQKLQPSLKLLVHNVVEVLSGKCNGFVIVEIWARKNEHSETEYDPSQVRPAFRITASPQRPPTRTIEVFEEALKKIRHNRKSSTVEINYDKNRVPSRYTSLLSRTETKRLNCFIIGLEISPIYRHPDTGEVFPLILRKLHRGFAQAIKKAVFEFSHNQTILRPQSYQTLGRRATVKAVWEVDAKLADISNQFDFLLLSTPVNIESELNNFQKNKFDKTPVFFYRPRPVDPSMLKRKLYEIHIDRIEDPTLATLFYGKRIEIDRQITMLGDRNTRAFLFGSLQLYGTVNKELLHLAENILQTMPPHSRDQHLQDFLNAKEFAEYAQKELDYYYKLYPEISATVQIRDDIVGLMVSRGNLLISRKVNIPVNRREALLQHEIGTHVLTYFNGRAQPLKLLYSGMTGYEELQEGLAVLAEFFVGGLNKARLRLLAGRIIAAHNMINDASFIDTFRLLNKEYGFSQRTSFIITARIFRAGGFTKDIVYLRGLVNLLDYLKTDGELAPLFVGKIALEHIAFIKELQMRKVLYPIPLYPRYLDSAEFRAKLEHLKNGISIIDLVGGNN